MTDIHDRKRVSPRTIVLGFVWVLGLLALYVVLDQYVESKFEHRIRDPAFLEEIASRVRPALIFDTNESILLDLGGMKYIDRIRIIVGKESPHPEKIILTPKAYLAHAPLLENLDHIVYQIHTQRGKGLDWEYVFEGDIHLPGGPSSKCPRFRLEVIPQR